MGLPLTPAVASNTIAYANVETPVLSRDQMYYEIGDHLGNVRAVVTGNMIATGGNVLNDRLNTNMSNWTSTGTTTVESHRAKVTGSLARSVTVTNAAVYRLSFRYQGATSVTVDGTTTTLTSSTEAWGEYIFAAAATTANVSLASTGLDAAYFDDIRLDRIDNKAVQIVSLKDYYPFGAVMKGRSYTASSGKYKYGFNGMEQDPEDEDYTTQYRLYDPGIGRWFSMDPLVYDDETPYSFVSNNPVSLVDPLGLEGRRKFSAYRSEFGKPSFVKTLQGIITNFGTFLKKVLNIVTKLRIANDKLKEKQFRDSMIKKLKEGDGRMGSSDKDRPNPKERSFYGPRNNPENYSNNFILDNLRDLEKYIKTTIGESTVVDNDKNIDKSGEHAVSHNENSNGDLNENVISGKTNPGSAQQPNNNNSNDKPVLNPTSDKSNYPVYDDDTKTIEYKDSIVYIEGNDNENGTYSYDKYGNKIGGTIYKEEYRKKIQGY